MTEQSKAPLVATHGFIWPSNVDDMFGALVGRGWDFTPGFDDDGHLDRLLGAFTWESDGVVDALRIKGPTDVGAMRADHAGGLLWEREGTVDFVLEQLLELPPPEDRRAPRLVRASAPVLWTPVVRVG